VRHLNSTVRSTVRKHYKGAPFGDCQPLVGDFLLKIMTNGIPFATDNSPKD